MGKLDYNTVHDLAKKWLDGLKASYKKFISFDKSGHTPQWEESKKFNSIFAKEVLRTELIFKISNDIDGELEFFKQIFCN